MSEDTTHFEFIIPEGIEIPTDAIEAFFRARIADDEVDIHVNVGEDDAESRYDVHLEFFLFEPAERDQAMHDLAAMGAQRIVCTEWYDGTGETNVFPLVDGEVLEFLSEEEYIDFLSEEDEEYDDDAEDNDEPDNDAPDDGDIDAALLAHAAEQESYLLLTFLIDQRPDTKSLAKFKSVVRGPFEEGYIPVVKSAFADGRMALLYAGYIFPDELGFLVAENGGNLVAKCFDLVTALGGREPLIRIHHDEKGAECEARLEGGKPVCEYTQRGGYMSGDVRPAQAGYMYGVDSYTDNDAGRQAHALMTRLFDTLELSQTAAGAGVDECNKRLERVCQRLGLKIVPGLKKNGVQNALVVLDRDQGKAIAKTFERKSDALEWIALRIVNERDGQFASGDYAVFDAVEDVVYSLDTEYHWAPTSSQ
ncbi:MAG: hypothetical protein H6981_08275 [Gammaproteobacteria bacterium]|nr:hypothetical protein [Gammaproteobacteria bacterium]MCP5136782.1 hypothetical protein [Gammaproteobacteria bacterium]